MVKSTGKRRFHLKSISPADPALKALRQWPSANRRFYIRFRDWLTAGGYSPSALNIYGTAVRLALAYLKKPFRKIDPDTDLERVRDHIASRGFSENTRADYAKGLSKLAQFLHGRKAKTVQDVNWNYYVDNLPGWLVEALREYIAFRRKSCRPDQYYHYTQELLCRLAAPLRWMAARTSLENPEEITPTLWFDYLENRLVAGISPRTVNVELHNLQSLLVYLEDAGMPVCPRMLFVKGLKEPRYLPRDAPPDHLRLVYRAIQLETHNPRPSIRRLGVMDKAWFLLMLHAGLRTCEIRRLKEADIDWGRRKVRIEQSKGMKDRFVYLSQAACDALRAYLLLRVRSLLPVSRYSFYRHDPLGSSYCQQRLNTYGRRCGIRLTPHQLRHSCATLLLNAGAPILTVQALLGHRRIDTTLIYARLYDGTIAADYYQAMGKIEGHLALDELDSDPLPDPRGEILALIAALQTDLLAENQASIVQDLKTKVLSSYLCDVKVPVEPN